MRASTKNKNRILFTRQMAVLLSAGLPLLKSLQLLEKEMGSSFLKKMIQQLIASLEEGSSFSEAMRHYPTFFSPLSIGMTRAGEQIGMLALAFQRLLILEEKREKINRKMISLTIYPLILLVMTGLIVVLLLTFVIPQFETIFHELLHEKPLPLSTQLLLNLSHALTHYGWSIGGGVILFFLLGKIAGHLQQKKLLFLEILWRIPFLSEIFQKKELAQVFGMLGTLLEQGVPLFQAFSTTAEMATHRRMRHAITTIVQSLEEGDPLSLPIKSIPLFPSMVVSMIAVGEEVGQLPAMLLKIASLYEEEVDESIARLLAISEPVLLLLLALLIGGIVVMLFLPLVNLLSEF